MCVICLAFWLRYYVIVCVLFSQLVTTVEKCDHWLTAGMCIHWLTAEMCDHWLTAGMCVTWLTAGKVLQEVQTMIAVHLCMHSATLPCLRSRHQRRKGNPSIREHYQHLALLCNGDWWFQCLNDNSSVVAGLVHFVIKLWLSCWSPGGACDCPDITNSSFVWAVFICTCRYMKMVFNSEYSKNCVKLMYMHWRHWSRMYWFVYNICWQNKTWKPYWTCTPPLIHQQTDILLSKPWICKFLFVTLPAYISAVFILDTFN